MNVALPNRLALVVVACAAAACSREPTPPAAAPSAAVPAATHATLIGLEAAFAAAARERGVKAAFPEYLDEELIVLQPGPVRGRAAWTVRKEQQATLDWLPDRAQLSQAGDHGFTTGPWLFTPKDLKTGRAEGRYLTVWREIGDRWYVLFDGGFGREPVGAWLFNCARIYRRAEASCDQLCCGRARTLREPATPD
jgi:ketosteroid isomerase-like protein